MTKERLTDHRDNLPGKSLGERLQVYHTDGMKSFPDMITHPVVLLHYQLKEQAVWIVLIQQHAIIIIIITSFI